MVSTTDAVETLSEAFLASSVDGTKEAVLDGGALSFAVGRKTLDRCAEYRRTQGIAWAPKTNACEKTLRFGNEATSRRTTVKVIPVNFAG